MTSGRFRFESFLLDPVDRRLLRDGAPVELNARYLDALSLLASEAGKLVSKDRFMNEIWRGVPVTDEALTQCIRTLRRQLGDDAVRPRFIETVPKHGYRFIAPVERIDDEPDSPALSTPEPARRDARRRFLLLGAYGLIGAAFAGLIGGISYGFLATASGAGAASVLLVLTSLTLFVALIGGAGVSFGIAAAEAAAGGPSPWGVAGGAAGGLIVGAMTKLLGLDAFHLLLGQAPAGITGGAEGVMIGGAVGMGAWLAARMSVRRGAALAAVCGGAAGLAIALLGGRLMGGSLDLLAAQFPASRLSISEIGRLFGESGFGPVSQAVTGGLEGALFAGCLVGAMAIARRAL